MSHPRASAPALRRRPLSLVVLGLLAYAVGVVLLVVAYQVLSSTPTVQASVVPPQFEADSGPTDVDVICSAPLTGADDDDDADEVDLPEVLEADVDDQAGVLAACSRERDQATARAVLIASGGVLVAVLGTGALGWAAGRRRRLPVG